MSRKVYVHVKVRLILDVDVGVDVSEVISEMDYNFIPDLSQATLVDAEILDHEVVDSK